MKKIFAAAALLAAYMMCAGSPSTLTMLEKRSQKLESEAETIREKDPDFADWVRNQASIYRSFKKACLYDLKYDPYELPGILEEWQDLLSKMEREIQIFRAMPDLEAAGLVSVKEFGTKADGKTDDAPAIQKAIEFAVKNGKGGIRIPKGRYLLKRTSRAYRAPMLRFHNIRNFKVKGEEGTVLVMSSPKTPFFDIDNCENLRFENFHVTALKPVYSTGIITGHTEDRGLIVKYDGGLPPSDDEFKKCEMKLFRVYDAKVAEDGKTPLLTTGPLHLRKRILFFNRRDITPVKGDEYKVYPDLWSKNEDVAKSFGKGARVVYFARNHMGGFMFVNSDRCRLKRISMNRVGGLAAKNVNGNTMFITDCTVVPAPEEKFSFATCADFYWGRCSSLGGYIARNTVSGLGDDFFNMHSTMFPVLRQEGNVIYIPKDQFYVDSLSRHCKQIRSIDLIPSFGDRKYIGRNTRYKVVSAEKVKIKHLPTYLNLTREQVVAVMSGRSRGIDKIATVEKKPVELDVIKLVLDRNPGPLECAEPFISWEEYSLLRRAKKFHLVHLPDFYSQGQVISDNYFADCVGRSWIMGSAALLKNNTFSFRMPRSLICAWNFFESNWAESFFPRIVTYENNKFRSLPHTAINLDWTRYNADDQSTWMRHVYMINNTFLLDLTSCFYGTKEKYAPPPLINAQGVADMEITGNTFFIPSEQLGPRLFLKNFKGRVDNNKFIGRLNPDNLTNVQFLPEQ